jgi:hypothetical protein
VQRCEAAKDIATRIQNEHQYIRVSVASLVKIFSAEIVAISSPQKHKSLPMELVEKRWKDEDDQ